MSLMRKEEAEDWTQGLAGTQVSPAALRTQHSVL